jgi:hypothetical protein
MMMTLRVNFIGPFYKEGFRLISKCPAKVVRDRAHLGVHECAPEDRLVTEELERDVFKLCQCRI